MIIDSHSHLGRSRSAFFTDEGESKLLRYTENTDTLLLSMKRNSITLSVVFPLPMISDQQTEANDELMGLIGGIHSLIPFAYLDPRRKESPRLLEIFIAKGCKGLKLHPVGHGYVVSNSVSYPTFEVASAHSLPIIIHSGWGEFGEIRFIAQLAKAFPNLKIIIGHLIEYKDIFELIPPLENVSVETSFSSHPRRIAQAVNILGADRILFGSDFPYSDQGLELYKIFTSSITDAEKEKILGKNASRLMSITP